MAPACPNANAACAASELTRERSSARRERGNRGNRALLLLRDHARDVPLRHVRDLVRQHTRHLGFALRGEQQPDVDADEAAGQRESVDLAVEDQEEIEFLARIGAARASRLPRRVR